MKTHNWRIAQTGETSFEVQINHKFLWWSWWAEIETERTLAKAQHTMEKWIFHRHAYPRVVDEVTDEIGYVRARLNCKGEE